MENQKSGPGLAWNLGFVKEKKFEPQVKKISKIGQVGKCGEQTSLVQTFHRPDLGAAAGNFLEFFLEKIAILKPFGSHFASF